MTKGEEPIAAEIESFLQRVENLGQTMLIGSRTAAHPGGERADGREVSGRNESTQSGAAPRGSH